MARDLSRAHAAGVDYLLACQHADGTWRDYHRMPLGPAIQWVTGFVGAALAEVATANRATARAAAALLDSRSRDGGWGFNAAVDSDADSTAWAILLLAGTGAEVPCEAIAFLQSLQRADGGFATYSRRDAWGVSHPDVTPIAALASAPYEPHASERALTYALKMVDHDGTWPAYWWRGRHYSSYWNRILLAAHGRRVISQGPAPAESSRWIVSTFDLAWALAMSVADRDPEPAIRALALMLCERQGVAGGWTGAADLRVTAPICATPWKQELGAYCFDDAGLITTASAIRALGLAITALTKGQPCSV